MNFQVEGIVKYVGPVVNVTESFRKRDLVLIIDPGQYEQVIKIEAANDKCDNKELNEVVPGYKVKVDINLRGRETNSQRNPGTMDVFNTLSFWKMAILQSVPVNGAPQYQQPQGQYQPPQQQYQQPAQQYQAPPQYQQAPPQYQQPPAQPQQQQGPPPQYQQAPPQYQQAPPQPQYQQAPPQYQQPAQPQYQQTPPPSQVPPNYGPPGVDDDLPF